MKNDQLVREIDEIERTLVQDDPALEKRFRKLQHANTRNDVAVFSLLTISAVLLAVALATLSLAASCVGVGAYIASFLVDNRHERTLRRPRRGERTLRRGSSTAASGAQ